MRLLVAFFVLGTLYQVVSAQKSVGQAVRQYSTTLSKLKSALLYVDDYYERGPAFPKYMPASHSKRQPVTESHYEWAFRGEKIYQKSVVYLADANPPGEVQTINVFDGKEEYMHYGDPQAGHKKEYTQGSVGGYQLRGAPDLFCLFRKVDSESLPSLLNSGKFSVKHQLPNGDLTIVGATLDGRSIEILLSKANGYLPKFMCWSVLVFGKLAVRKVEVTEFFREGDVVLPISGTNELVAANGETIWRRRLRSKVVQLNSVPDALFTISFPVGTGVTYPDDTLRIISPPRRIGTGLFIVGVSGLLFVAAILMRAKLRYLADEKRTT